MAGARLRRWTWVVVVLLLATGCDGDDAGAAGDGDAAANAGEAAEDALCALVAGVDLEAAFDGQITFGELDARSPRACVVPIDGTGGEGLTVQLGNADGRA